MSGEYQSSEVSGADAERILRCHLRSLSDQDSGTEQLHRHAVRQFLGFARTATSHKSRLVINEPALIKWIVHTSDGAAASYAAKQFQALDRYLDAVVRAGLMTSNPMAAFKISHGSRRWAEIARVAQSHDPEKALADCRVDLPPPSPLHEHLRAYLRLHRAVGKNYKLNEGALGTLDRFLRSQAVASVGDVTPEVIRRWTDQMTCGPVRRLQMVRMARRFFEHLLAAEVIVQNPLGAGMGYDERAPKTSFRPFIFTQQQMAAILDAAKRLPRNHLFPLRPQVSHTLIAMLYVLGLRVGEACRLRLRDVDLDRGILLIRQTKFHKSRMVPFGPRMGDLLRRYLDARHTVLQPVKDEDPLFVALWRKPLAQTTLGPIFRHLLTAVGITRKKGRCGPRLHDLRHAFAVHRLLRWYREGADVQSRLMGLSTFMGHVEIRSTEIYLTITADLLKEANDRFHRRFGHVAGEEVAP
ncbi:MAG TPA: tyrosine-type recombinase/integrase [Phycisphaerae bacterium]|nr:tyrosine-type recombinase/integrase [Phycisphaerae bacterium]